MGIGRLTEKGEVAVNYFEMELGQIITNLTIS